MAERKCVQMTPEQEAVAVAFIEDLYEMTESKGKHEGHTLRQVGRCVYCSCNARYQGTLPRKDKS